MKTGHLRVAAGGGPAIVLIALYLGAAHRSKAPHYLDGNTTPFVALFDAPPTRDSPATRQELEELLDLQKSRTPTQVAAARADRHTEVDRFFGALGIDA